MSAVPRFVIAIRVREADIDRLGHVNNVAFLRFVQDAAAAHWTAIAPDDVRDAFTWVVRRHEIEYLRPGFLNDELEAQTWVGEPSGATWERLTEIFRKGEVRPLVTARTIWVLLDAVTGRPRRIDADLVAQIAITPAAGDRAASPST